MNHPHDHLPLSAAASAIVRKITMRLSCELAFNGHPTLSQVECAGMFNLADACEQLDRIAILPRMAQAETRARRDLLELFETFHPFDPLEQTAEMPKVWVHPFASIAESARLRAALDGLDVLGMGQPVQS